MRKLEFLHTFKEISTPKGITQLISLISALSFIASITYVSFLSQTIGIDVTAYASISDYLEISIIPIAATIGVFPICLVSANSLVHILWRYQRRTQRRLAKYKLSDPQLALLTENLAVITVLGALIAGFTRRVATSINTTPRPSPEPWDIGGFLIIATLTISICWVLTTDVKEITRTTYRLVGSTLLPIILITSGTVGAERGIQKSTPDNVEPRLQLALTSPPDTLVGEPVLSLTRGLVFVEAESADLSIIPHRRIAQIESLSRR